MTDHAKEQLSEQSACDDLADALRPFVFDWDQAVAALEDHTEEDMADLQLGEMVSKATMERALEALRRYDQKARSNGETITIWRERA